MLIRFNFTNFKSYKNETNLLLTSNSKIRTKKEHEAQISNKLNALKFSCIYGDNSSGKTNLLLAIEFFKMYTVYGMRPEFDFLSFKGNEGEPTKMDMIFSIGESVYQYGFELKREHDIIFKTKVIDEYLSLVSAPGRRTSMIYSKQEGLNLNYFKNYTSADVDHFKFITGNYINSNSVSDELLFLTFACKPEYYRENNPIYDELIKIYNYLKNNIVVIGPKTNTLRVIDDFNLKTITRYTKCFDPAIVDIKLEQVDINEAKQKMPKDIFEQTIAKFQKGLAKNAFINIGSNRFYFASLNNEGRIEFNEMALYHKYIENKFYFNDESEGTRRFITLMSYFATQDKNTTFIIDEVERSMYPASIEYLFKFCETETVENNSQFIFSSHDDIFMERLLRRDEIYFVDKDIYAQSALYPLTDFQTRTDSNLVKSFEKGDFRKYSINREYVNHGSSSC